MKIPRIPVGRHQGKNWAVTNPAGKGSWPPRNMSEGLRENLAGVVRGPTHRSANGHTRIVYSGHQKTEITVALDGSEIRKVSELPD